MPESFEEYVSVRGGTLLKFAYVLCGDRQLAEPGFDFLLTADRNGPLNQANLIHSAAGVAKQ